MIVLYSSLTLFQSTDAYILVVSISYSSNAGRSKLLS